MKLITVAIVEDLSEVRESIQQLITGSEHFLLTGSFENAESACEALPTLKPDLVIMDINLPGISGIECIRNVKPQCPGTQFMMYTIFEDDEKVFEALEAGAHGYLLKKTPRETILNALLELYEGGSPMSTHIARKVINSFEKKHAVQNNILLSPREKQVLDWLAKGFLYKEIAEKLDISINTIKQHIHKIYEKLHVSNRTEAINKVFGKDW